MLGPRWKSESLNRRPIIVALMLLVRCLFPSGLSGQELPVTPETVGGLQSLRPVVPLLESRRGTASSEGQTWRAVREGAELAPTSSFIDSLKANDAALELIVGQGRLLTTRKPIAREDGIALIAVGDPTVLEFEILPNPQMIRITGKRAGTTDLTIVTSDKETYVFEAHVVYDLELLRAQLRQLYPDATLQLAQLRDHIIVEGQARSPSQVTSIETTISAFLSSAQTTTSVQSQGGAPDVGDPGDGTRRRGRDSRDQMESDTADPESRQPADDQGQARPERGVRPSSQATFPKAQIINLIRVPGVQQVLLQVRVAELDRTGLREIGADLLAGTSSGSVFGTQIGGSTVTAGGTFLGSLAARASHSVGGPSTAFAIFPSADVSVILRALRQNNVLSILAEPNLVTMSGHQASFLAGGQFPVPVPQGGGGGSNNVTIQFKDFGVQLNFIPYILGDETIRLNVAPEVSTIDASLGTTLVAGGQPVPGISTRRLNTTVELKEGQTLALAGLMQVTMNATTSRIPGLGDLPYLGPLFSNSTHQRVEKELLILVSPFLVSPLSAEQIPALPGTEVNDPTDLEFYLLNRIEGRTGRTFRATTSWDAPFRRMKLEQQYIHGSVGFSP